MRTMKMNTTFSKSRILLVPVLVMLFAATVYASAPGITGTTFNLTARDAFISQPDGASVYSWGYGCSSAPSGFAPPATLMPGATCPTMQVPGPTLIVTEGATVTVNLTNNLPTSAGNTSILFPGFTVTATGGVAGLLTQEAQPCPSPSPCGTNTVSYSFVASSPGTRAYYSGTQGDLQVEMGLYGAIIVLPSNPTVLSACATAQTNNQAARANWGESDYRLAVAAYDNPRSCYDREYLFQFSEMDPGIHKNALAQVTARTGCAASSPTCHLDDS